MLPPVASPPAAVSEILVSPVAVPADPNLISRTVYADGSIGECRRVAIERPDWLNIECRTGPFLKRAAVRPLAPRSPPRWPRLSESRQ